MAGTPSGDDRRKFLRQIAGFYLAAVAIGALTIYLPISPGDRSLPAIVIEIVIGVIAAGVIFAFPWHRYDPDAFVVMGMVAVTQLGIFIWATGGVESPYWPMALLNVVGVAAVYRGRWPIVVVAVTSVATLAAPALYDQPVTTAQAMDIIIRSLVIGVSFVFSWFAAEQIRRHAAVATQLLPERDVVNRRRQLTQLVRHELGNPLMLIQGYGERILAKGDVAESSRKELQTMQRSWERMRRLLEDLREYDEVEGRLKLEPAVADLGKVVEDAVVGYRQIAPGRTFNFENCNTTPVKIDPFRVSQVVDNLLQNAVRYSSEGSPIRVDVTHEDGAVCVSVADSGVGTPEDIQGRIFTAFFLGRQAGVASVPGSGLGLSISKEIVEAHGGRIWFFSTLGAGTTFYFKVPA